MNIDEERAMLIDALENIIWTAERGVNAEDGKRWQYLEEIASSAAYALRKCGVQE